MLTRRFAMIMGIIFLVVGVLGFIPGITVMHHDDPNLRVEGPGHGYLLGLFHVNVLHNVVHILFGIAGIAAASTFVAARNYARFVAVAYILLAILGMIPTANTWNTWGLIPLHGNDVWLHLLIAVAAAYFGFVVHAPGEERDSRFTHTAPRV
jgi:hypothetical protein